MTHLYNFLISSTIDVSNKTFIIRFSGVFSLLKMFFFCYREWFNVSFNLTCTRQSAWFLPYYSPTPAIIRYEGWCSELLTGCCTDEMMFTPRERANLWRWSICARFSWERLRWTWASWALSSSFGCSRNSSPLDLKRCSSWNIGH